MKKHLPAIVTFSVLSLLVIDTTLASGGFRQRAPQPTVSAPAPVVQTSQLSELDLEIKREVEALGVEFPTDWTQWSLAEQDQFLADLDFLDEAPTANDPQVINKGVPEPVFQPQAVFNPAPRVQRRTTRVIPTAEPTGAITAEELVLDTLRSLGFGIPSTFTRWTDRKKRSFLKTLLRNDLKKTPANRTVSSPEAINRAVPVPATEVIAPEVQAEYDAEQAASQAAQAERIAEVAAPEYVTISTGSLQGAAGKTAVGNITVEAKGDQVMITLEDNFNISNGPDLFVTLTTEDVTNKRSLNPTKLIKLDALANTAGKQVYTVSKADFEAYGDSLAIWCQAFNVLFGATELQ